MKRIVYLGSMSLFLVACGEASRKEPNEAEFLNSEASSSISDSLQTQLELRSDLKDPRSDLVKTARLKLETKEINKSVDYLENKVIELGGFIQHSQVRREILSDIEYPYSADSSTRVRNSRHFAELEVKVPSGKMNDFLVALQVEGIQIINRELEANSVSFDLLEARLEQQRQEAYTNQLVKTSEPSKIKDAGKAIYTQEVLMERNRMADLARLEQLRLQEKINFATINLEIEQPNLIEQSLVYNTQFREHPKEPLGRKFLVAFEDGFVVFEKFALFLVRIWSLLLLAGIGFWAYRRFGFLLKRRVQ